MSSSASGGPARYAFITPVWGEAYTERYVKLCLPTQLAAGNLPAVPADRAEYLIYTRRENARAIARSSAYRRLKRLMPASIRLLDNLPDPDIAGNQHELQTAAYTRGIAAAGPGAACVFLTPDFLIADGAFASLVRLAESGKRVVLMLSPRMSAIGATSCAARYAAYGVVTIPPRDLVRSCLDNLHPISAAHVVARGQVRAPQHFYWRVGSNGLLARGFHIHPLLVWPRNAAASIRNTLDDEYIGVACPDRAEWHTVTDSDELCVAEFSEVRYKHDVFAPEPCTDVDILKFMIRHTTESHREHVLKSIRFHTGGFEGPEWTETAARAERLVGRYLGLFQERFPDAGVAPPDLAHTLSVRFSELLTPEHADGNRAPRSLRQLVTTGMAAPFWMLYRLLHARLYRQVDRLNSEVIELRNLIAETRHGLESTNARAEDIRGELERKIVRTVRDGIPRKRRRAGSRRANREAGAEKPR